MNEPTAKRVKFDKALIVDHDDTAAVYPPPVRPDGYHNQSTSIRALNTY